MATDFEIAGDMLATDLPTNGLCSACFLED
jgi:hypothetical protein